MNGIVTNTRALTLAEVATLPAEILDFAGFNDNDDDDEVMTEFLQTYDFIIADLDLGGKKYTMVHGFPGDNPAGIIFNEEGHHLIGETAPQNSIPQKWYAKVTGDICDFSAVWWYPSKEVPTTEKTIARFFGTDNPAILHKFENLKSIDDFNEHMATMFDENDPVGCTCCEFHPDPVIRATHVNSSDH